MNVGTILLAVLVLGAENGLAQEATSQASRLNLRVLESREVRRGNKTTVYQRVEPPVLPPRPPAAARPAEEPRPRVLTGEQQRRAAKNHDVLMLSATVYEGEGTVLWWFEKGRVYRGLSSADFSLLAGRGEIETEDTIYWLIMVVAPPPVERVDLPNRRFITQQLSAALRQWGAQENLSSARAEYALTEDSANPLPAAETLAALDALHVYHDENKPALIAARAQRALDLAAHEAAARVEDAKPKRTVVRFWDLPGAASPVQK